MSDNKQKLELTWVGKNNPEYDISNIEPRILEENPELSNCKNDPNTENMIIHGDNLLALKALLPEYEGKIKCIYIDPPYNTGNAFEHYDDSVEHSTWLSLMKPRLELLRMLLKDDGVFLAQIDKIQNAYLKILLDEVFGRQFYITTLAIRMSATSGFKIEHTDKTIVKNVEYIHLYSFNLDIKEKSFEENMEYDSHYSLIINENMGILTFNRLTEEPFVKNQMTSYNLPITNDSLSILYSRSNEFRDYIRENSEYICRSHTAPSLARQEYLNGQLLNNSESNRVEIKEYSGTKYFLRKTLSGVDQLIPIKLKMNFVDKTGIKDVLSLTNILGDWWDGFHLDMGNVENEGGVEFKNGKKPERLLRRIFRMFTLPGDLVLDSFLGSGTTAAVAHKMGRKYIGIEMGNHAYTHCKVRLDNVISGFDQSGISSSVDWKGGGAYKFYELAPSFIAIDEFGNPVIDSYYNDSKLIKAMCKLLNYTYKPSDSEYWKHGIGQGKNYLYVTTQFLTTGMVQQIASHLLEGETLVISPKKFEPGADKVDRRIVIKKIPQSVLKACHYGKKEYLLPIKESSIEEAGIEEETE
jgi:adenine-specific DNA-methyltransferase